MPSIDIDASNAKKLGLQSVLINADALHTAVSHVAHSCSFDLLIQASAAVVACITPEMSDLQTTKGYVQWSKHRDGPTSGIILWLGVIYL